MSKKSILLHTSDIIWGAEESSSICWNSLQFSKTFLMKKQKKKVCPSYTHTTNMHQYYNRTCQCLAIQFIMEKAFCLAMRGKSLKYTQNPTDVNGRKYPLRTVQKWEYRGEARFAVADFVHDTQKMWSPLKQSSLLQMPAQQHHKFSAKSLSISILDLIRPTSCHGCQVRDSFVSCSGLSI